MEEEGIVMGGGLEVEMRASCGESNQMQSSFYRAVSVNGGERCGQNVGFKTG